MPGPEKPIAHPFVRREIDFEDERRAPERGRGASVTWIVLAVGLGLSLLLFKLGIWFFFLPIVIPFGFGGRSLFGGRSARRRTIRLEGGILSVYTRSLLGSTRDGAIDVSEGVTVSISVGAVPAGDEAVVRFVGTAGGLEVPCADLLRAQELEQQVEAMLAEAGVRLRRE